MLDGKRDFMGSLFLKIVAIVLLCGYGLPQQQPWQTLARQEGQVQLEVTGIILLFTAM